MSELSLTGVIYARDSFPRIVVLEIHQFCRLRTKQNWRISKTTIRRTACSLPLDGEIRDPVLQIIILDKRQYRFVRQCSVAAVCHTKLKGRIYKTTIRRTYPTVTTCITNEHKCRYAPPFSWSLFCRYVLSSFQLCTVELMIGLSLLSSLQVLDPMLLYPPYPTDNIDDQKLRQKPFPYSVVQFLVWSEFRFSIVSLQFGFSVFGSSCYFVTFNLFWSSHKLLSR